MNDKRGVSPVIATVLLISIVIILAVIVFLWAYKGVIPETILKQGKNIELVCNDVNLEVSYSGNSVEITNSGDVPIYKLKIQKTKSGNTDSQEEKGLDIGESSNYTIGENYEVEVFPVLLGESSDTKKTYICKKGFK